MARLVIESFQKGIQKLEREIAKLEKRKEKLQEKIENTVLCPKCKNYWDALYLKSMKGSCIVWECPLCSTLIQTPLKEEIDFTVENMERVTKVKDIFNSVKPILKV